MADYKHLPYTLSHPLEQYYAYKEAAVWSKAMNYALDFFEISVQYLTIVLLGMMRNREGHEQSQYLQQVISIIDRKRPLSFGDWANDLLPRAIYAAKEIMPDDAITIALGKIVSKRRNLLLGGKQEQSIIQIRNEYKGHSTVLAEEIYQSVAQTLNPRIEEMIDALSVFSNIKEVATTDTFTLQTNDKETIADLYPALHRTEQGYIYVFQSLKDEQIAYISANENAITLITDQYNDAFDHWGQAFVKSFDISKDKNWEENKQLMNAYSSDYLKRMYGEKKYNKELFVERDGLSDMFSRFLRSDERILPLPGQAGQGKTTQLCHWTEQLLQSADGVLTFASTEFAETTLEVLLRHIFDLSHKKNIHTFLTLLNQKAAAHQRKIVFMFDALNEVLTYPMMTEQVSSPLAIYKDIYALLCKPEYSSFRILFTCRNYTWENDLRPEVRKQDDRLFFNATDEDAEVRAFSDTEVERAYRIYQDLYQMQTPFEQLNRANVIRLKNPLVLKIVSTNYLGEDMPAAATEYTSTALFDKMTADVRRSYAGNKQWLILQEAADIILDSYLKGNAIDSIILSEVNHARTKASDPLHRIANLIFNTDGTTIAFHELLEKPERPILRLIKSEKIQFIYERYLEYMLAVRYYNRHKTEGAPISAATYLQTLSTAATNEVFLSVIRNVLIMDYLHTGNAQTLLELASEHADNNVVMTILNDVMQVVVTENYEDTAMRLMHIFITHTSDQTEQLIEQYSKASKIIEKNKADDRTISQHRQLREQLAPTINVRRLAASTLINTMFLTDYHNEALYHTDPYDMLWLLLDDNITEVKDTACMLIYYASSKRYTLTYTPLKSNLTVQIVKRMYDYVNSTPIVGLAIKQRRKRVVTYLETGTRLNVLLIIDTLLQTNTTGVDIRQIFADITKVARHLTGNFVFIRAVMPFVETVMRKQLTFQSDYVNNMIEYQTFWNDDCVSLKCQEKGWSREMLTRMAPLSFTQSAPERTLGLSMSDFTDNVVAAYMLGDSTSYFFIERLLIIAGVHDITTVHPIMQQLRDGSNRQTEWFDYSQMSFIYVLYQLGLKTEHLDPFVWQMLGEWCKEWTLRCRGWFKGRNSHKANIHQLYKRQVMAWYAMVYCYRYGDKRDEAGLSVPVFRELIDMAIRERDKELLVHLINNISELIYDSGYIHTALDLLYQLMAPISSEKILQEFEDKADLRYEDTRKSIVSIIGNVLGTANNYFPQEIKNFISKDLRTINFPGTEQYRQDTLGMNVGGERLSDLFTHKFGNALIQMLVSQSVVDEVFADANIATLTAKDGYQWYDRLIRIVINKLFNLRL